MYVPRWLPTIGEESSVVDGCANHSGSNGRIAFSELGADSPGVRFLQQVQGSVGSTPRAYGLDDKQMLPKASGWFVRTSWRNSDDNDVV